MKKHAIIPVFIPHLGCQNDCVFCNQRKITARSSAPTTEDVRSTIREWLTTLEDVPSVEVAFYGGSFTGLPIEDQTAYISVAEEFLSEGLIDGIHLSTRPDYINEEILDNLKKHHVKTIEIGVQSFDDAVLKASNRGHSSADVYRASKLIKEYGFVLGIQLMIGLPGDSLESCIFSAKEAVALKPELARLYPTIVLDDTRLLEMYQEGTYEALSRNEAVRRTAAMYRILDDAGIYIMRVGLKSTDVIGDGGAINGGTYHPAFRQLVEGQIMRENIEDALVQKLGELPSSSEGKSRKVDIYSCPSWFSNMIGNSGSNRDYFHKKYPALDIKYRIDDSLSSGQCRIDIKE